MGDTVITAAAVLKLATRGIAVSLSHPIPAILFYHMTYYSGSHILLRLYFWFSTEQPNR